MMKFFIQYLALFDFTLIFLGYVADSGASMQLP